MRPIVKICGFTRPQDVRMCVHHGVDIVGFVVDYPRPVPWNINVESAKELISAVSGMAKTCVVTGGTLDAVLKLALETQPDYVQLHYGETLSDTARLAGELGKHGIQIIKTVFPDTPAKAALDFSTAGVYALLYDPRTPENATGGGAADIDAFIKLKCAVNCPVILAGGITPENAADMVLRTEAHIIDLMTGVEHSPGIKSGKKVAALFQALESVH